jgi:hypothetical protein
MVNVSGSRRSDRLGDSKKALVQAEPQYRRWKILKPYSGAISQTGYVRAAQRAVFELYGINEISDRTCAIKINLPEKKL